MGYLKILIPVLVVVAIIIVVPIAVVFSRSEPDAARPVVNTTVGYIRGFISQDDGHSMFLGIPYAVVDGRNPFGAATPNPRFEDVFDASRDTVACPQRRASGSLDCLRMNIIVPNTEASRPLPVMVYIHGGRFVMGTSTIQRFGPQFLVRHDVIYVSFHYRLNAFGFMCLHTADVPGNQGLKDQLSALRWIKNNIRSFGGDDENITIFGDSAGGVSVDLLLHFAEEGLFHRVISQSGTALAPWGIEEPNLEAPFEIARLLGLNTTDLNTALDFLSNQSPQRVADAASESSVTFLPCVEREFPNVERLITRHTVNTPLPRAGNIPILVGYNDDEALFKYANMPAEAFERLDIFNHNIRMGFTFEETRERMKTYVRRFYAGDEPMSVALRRSVLDFESDFLFMHPAQRSLAKYLEYNGTAYHYVFTYMGGRNMMRIMSNMTEGRVSHADELGYLFDQPIFRDPPSDADQLIIDRITTLWTNFAKFGDPTPSTTPLLPIKWLPVSRDSLIYLNLTSDLQLQTRPFHQRLSFWDFFYSINKIYVRGYET